MEQFLWSHYPSPYICRYMASQGPNQYACTYKCAKPELYQQISCCFKTSFEIPWYSNSLKNHMYMYVGLYVWSVSDRSGLYYYTWIFGCVIFRNPLGLIPSPVLLMKNVTSGSSNPVSGPICLPGHLLREINYSISQNQWTAFLSCLVDATRAKTRQNEATPRQEGVPRKTWLFSISDHDIPT